MSLLRASNAAARHRFVSLTEHLVKITGNKPLKCLISGNVHHEVYRDLQGNFGKGIINTDNNKVVDNSEKSHSLPPEISEFKRFITINYPLGLTTRKFDLVYLDYNVLPSGNRGIMPMSDIFDVSLHALSNNVVLGLTVNLDPELMAKWPRNFGTLEETTLKQTNNIMKNTGYDIVHREVIRFMDADSDKKTKNRKLFVGFMARRYKREREYNPYVYQKGKVWGFGI